MSKTETAVEVFDKNAQLYQDKFMNVDLYADSFNLFCDSIPNKNGKILELACGPGNITQFLLSKRPDLQITGTDLSVNMLELAKKNNPSADFQKMDCRDLHKIKDKYDGLMIGFALPYVSKEEAIKMIHDGSKILNQQGLIYISTMENDYVKSGWETSPSGNTMYMHYHQADYLSDTLIKEGFEIILLDRKEYVDSSGKQVKDLILIGRKK